MPAQLQEIKFYGLRVVQVIQGGVTLVAKAVLVVLVDFSAQADLVGMVAPAALTACEVVLVAGAVQAQIHQQKLPLGGG